MMRTRCKLLHVNERSEATGQSASPAAGHDRKQCLRRIRKALQYALGGGHCHGATRQVTACHCEPVTDVTGVAIRNPCGSTKQNAILWANTESVTDLPEVAQTCQVSLRGNGLPHQCAHWFAMTCRRQKRVCGCKGDFPAVHRQYPGMMGPRGKFQHVIARSEATWQSVLLAVAQSEKQYLRQIRKSATDLP